MNANMLLESMHSIDPSVRTCTQTPEMEREEVRKKCKTDTHVTNKQMVKNSSEHICNSGW